MELAGHMARHQNWRHYLVYTSDFKEEELKAIMATCHMCDKNTKYSCILCKVPVCNICCSPEMDEEATGWASGSSVGYCDSCLLSTKEWSEGQEHQFERQTDSEGSTVGNPR